MEDILILSLGVWPEDSTQTACFPPAGAGLCCHSKDSQQPSRSRGPFGGLPERWLRGWVVSELPTPSLLLSRVPGDSCMEANRAGGRKRTSRRRLGSRRQRCNVEKECVCVWGGSICKCALQVNDFYMKVWNFTFPQPTPNIPESRLLGVSAGAPWEAAV